MSFFSSGLRPRLTAWRIGLWILLLTTCYAGAQYLRFHTYVQLAASLLLLVPCVGCILLQAWAWRPLRGLLLGLIGWFSWNLAHLLGQWGRFSVARQALQQVPSPALHDQVAAMLRQVERVFYLNLGLEALLLVGLLWLFVALGRPDVKSQFLSREQRRVGRSLV